MSSDLLIIIISLSIVLGLLIIYFLIRYYHHLIQEKIAIREKSDAIHRTIDKFFNKNEKELKIARFNDIESLRKKVEAQISLRSEERRTKAVKQLKNYSPDTEDIEEAGKVYLSFNIDLKTAAPRTTEERKKDMSDLMEAVKALEFMDKEQFRVSLSDESAIGKGMVYDTFSLKLQKIIKTQFYNYKFIQAEKLENVALDKIKHLDHEDFIETIKVMKQIGSIQDFIEINPEVNLIILGNEPFTFNQAEKVVLSYIADDDYPTTTKLKEKTLWTPEYFENIIQELQRKGCIEIKGEELISSGILTFDEKKQRSSKIHTIRSKKEEKKQELQKLSEKNRFDMNREINDIKGPTQDVLKQAQLPKLSLKETPTAVSSPENRKESNVEEETHLKSIQDQSKPIIHTLPYTNQINEPFNSNKQKPILNIHSSPNGINKTKKIPLSTDEDLSELKKVIEEVETISKKNTEPSIKLNPKQDNLSKTGSSTTNLASFFSESNGETIQGEDSQEDHISDEVIAFLETKNIPTGGIISLNRVFNYLIQGHYTDLKKEDLTSIINKLKENQFIKEIISTSENKILIFNPDVTLDDEMRKIIMLFSDKNKLTREELGKVLLWENEKINLVIQRFLDQKLLSTDPDGKYFLPGL